MGNLHFKTNVQIKSIIGKDLINDDNIAILELVKNSFDADAKRVDITFSNLKNNDDKEKQKEYPFTDNTSRIIIRDDGVGMDLSDIDDKWLNIAYSEKKSNSRQYNRMMAGAKGVGRFSCDRLGQYLNLYTRKKGKECLLLKIDWNKFEVDDQKKEIQSVDLEYETLNDIELEQTGIASFKQGVILEIIQLRSNWVRLEDNKWNTDKLAELKKYLEKLINPNQAFEKNDFGIYLNAPEFVSENNSKSQNEKFIGKVENTIFQKLDFKTTSIECKSIGDGGTILTTLKDKGDTIFWIKEQSDYFPEIQNFKITLYYLNTYAKAFFTKQTGMRSVAYGSVFLFLNGFRIPPYGEEGDDWLKLEQRKSQGYARFISARDLVGQIEILDSNNSFKIVSSREGLVKNDNYEKLAEKGGLFYRVLRRLEKYVVDGLNWDSIPDEDRNRVSEIEKKIISGELSEENLRYQEDAKTKRRRIYESIHSIINASPQKVIELYINEDLIESKIIEEKELAEQEFSRLLSDFENKKISGDQLAQILQKKAQESEELEKQLAVFSRYTTNEATAKAIAELQSYKETIEKQAKIIETLQKQLEDKDKEIASTQIDANERIKEAERKAKEEEGKRKKVEIELKQRTKQNLFLQSVGSLDTDRILKYHHDIRIHAATIHNTIGQILRKANQGSLSREDTIKMIERISRANDKITSIAQFATKANYSINADTINADIVNYIDEYINNVLPEFYGDIQLHCSNKSCTKVIDFSPLEASIFIDNLVSNTVKANAKHFDVVFEKDNDAVCMTISDDGDGLSPDIVNPNSILEKGYTTTNGSGLGLYNVATFVKTVMHGSISVENNQGKLGFKLRIKF